ncbi:MAG: Xaa-Pro peptidase family protein [Candidatus Amulumruptor caecigallinarius]|nr:Xaa-Pro peptidase family protein [Candidatus Amulumruptor caecigallinarius]
MNFPLLTKDLAGELRLRLEKVTEMMKRDGVDTLIAASTTNILYLTGGICRGYFYISTHRDPIFFILPPAESDNPLCRVIHKPELITGILESESYPAPQMLALESDDLLYSDFTRLRKIFPAASLANGSKILREARMIKTPYEIKMMRTDGMHQCEVYSRVKHCYREGMSDVEFQIEIERVMRLEGCLGYLRVAGSKMELNMGSLLAGENADVPSPYDFALGGAGVDPSLPAGASGIILRNGMTVMIDMNGGFNGYQTDMTRCWSVGDVPETVKHAHNCSRAILRDLEKFALPGVEIGALYRRTEEMVKAEGLEKYFMGFSHKVKFIGHGVGIELNEIPVVMERNRMPLQEGMTIALEPKFVIPPYGAAGVENTYLVTDHGLENLTPFPEELKQL